MKRLICKIERECKKCEIFKALFELITTCLLPLASATLSSGCEFGNPTNERASDTLHNLRLHLGTTVATHRLFYTINTKILFASNDKHHEDCGMHSNVGENLTLRSTGSMMHRFCKHLVSKTGLHLHCSFLSSTST